MKKLTAICLSLCLIITVLCGCNDTGSEDADANPIANLTEVDISQFPDAEDYDVYYWPTFGIASEIPVPSWSNRGWIDYDEEDHFRCYVGYTTPDDFHNYVAELQNFGFTVNYFNDGDWRFYAETEDGMGILLYYWEKDSHMCLEIARDCSVIEATYIF